jgi:MFS family permease
LSAPVRLSLVLLAAASALSFFAFGIRGTTGLFLAPISQEYGWGREIFAFSVALQMLIWGALVPPAGAIADKFGSARVLAVGAVFYAVGYALMAYAELPWQMHLAAGVMVGIGLAGTSLTIVVAVLARHTSPAQRSFVLGIATAVTSLGQFALLPIGQAFISAYGWHDAALLLGAMALVMFPLAFFVRSKGAAAPGMLDQPLKSALAEAFGTPSYVLLVIGFFVCGFQLFFIVNHLPAFVTDRGLPAWVGSATLALIGLTNVIGSLAAGWMGGRWSKKYGLAGMYFTRAAITTALLLLPLSPFTVLAWGAVMGTIWLATMPLTSGLVAQFFGLRWMATLFGIVFFSHQVGGFFGVWLGGLVFDLTKSYDVMWWIFVALGIVAGLLHLPIREAPVARLAGVRPA